MNKKNPLDELLWHLKNPVNYMVYPKIKSAYDTLVDNIKKDVADLENPLDGIDKAFAKVRKPSIKKYGWFGELNKEIKLFYRAKGKHNAQNQLQTSKSPAPKGNQSGASKQNTGKHVTQVPVSFDAKGQTKNLESCSKLLEEIWNMIGCEGTFGSNTDDAEGMYMLAVGIKTRLSEIESQCLDISKQITSLKCAFGVQRDDVYGGTSSISLWEDILRDIMAMKRDINDSRLMSGESKAQLAIHENVYQHNTKTHNRGPMPEIHKATDNKEGSSSTGQNENLTEKHEEKVQALQKEIDDLKKELEKRTNENKTLRDDEDSINEKYKQLQKEFDKVQKELDIEKEKEHMGTSKGQKETTDDKKSKNTGAPTRKETEYIDKLTNELKEEKDRNKQLRQEIKKTHEEIVKLQDNVDYWKNRVSKIAGSKLTDNNPGITDLSDPNRPTRLAEIFGEIYDNVWTDTLEGLNGTKKIKTEKEAVLHMASILKFCYICCEKKFDETLEQMRMVLLLKSQKKSGDAELDQEEEKQLKDMLKSVGVRTSKCLDWDDLIKCLTDRNLQKAMQKHQDVTKDFTKQCLEICWLMVIQDPPVVLYWGDSTVGSPIDADRFKAFTRSGDFLEYIVWPAVLLHADGPLLNKGIVQPQQSSQNTRL